MLNLKLAYKGRCPRHPRFNPERDGRGGVRGGCRVCDALCSVFEAMGRLRQSLQHADEVLSEQAALEQEAARRRQARVA